MFSHLTLVPLVGLTLEAQSTRAPSTDVKPTPSSSHSRAHSRTRSPATALAWLPVESSALATPTSTPAPSYVASYRSSNLNPESPAFEPLSPPEDSSFPIAVHTSPNRRKTLELPPSPPDSPPDSTSESLLSFARPTHKACRGRAPTRCGGGDSRARTHADAPPRRARARALSTASAPTTTSLVRPARTIAEEESEYDNSDASSDDTDDERFMSLPLLRLRHRLSTSLTLGTLPSFDDKTTSIPTESSSGSPRRRRRAFPPGTVWAEQSHYRLYALQRSKAERTCGVGYWKRWEGIDLE
ncbi:uncharacterized protein JCM15063_004757 [Sporobolomyces koalae]|uniref:uncharacterized protein n=1 Tax=Sporobolomyces koalae TaxID=500713 RepID=UPI003178A8C8